MGILEKDEICEDCKRMQISQAWIGEPPKCWKHQKDQAGPGRMG